MFDELARKRKRRSINSLSRRETRVILRSRMKTEHHKRQVMNPVRASQSSSQSRFQRSVKSLNHPITLRMKAGGLDPGDSEDRANLRPDQEVN